MPTRRRNPNRDDAADEVENAGVILGAGVTEVDGITRGFSELSFAFPEDDSTSADENAAEGLDETQRMCVERACAGESLFITGVGGTGKSKVLRAIRSALGAKGKRVATCATTGIAAQAISGTTLYALCGLSPTQTIERFGKAANFTKQLLERYDCLLVDEVSMLSGEFFDRMSFHLQMIRRNSAPCGGLQMIFFGDFLQLGPIDGTDKRQKTGRGCCPGLMLDRGWMFESWTWRQLGVQTITLEKVYRQLGELEFIETLKGVRMGDINACTKLDEMLKRSGASTKTMASALRIVSTNAEALEANTKELDRLQSVAYAWEAEDSVEASETLTDPERIADAERHLRRLWTSQLERQCRVDRLVKLKQGTKVMMLKNLYMNAKDENGRSYVKSLPNGARGFVHRFAPGQEVVEHLREKLREIERAMEDRSTSNAIADPMRAEREAHEMTRQMDTYRDQINWIEHQIEQEKKVLVPMVSFPDCLGEQAIPVLPVDFTFETVGLGKNIRKQIPLALAWAVTVHKSQGMSLDRAHVECGNFFAEGQAYVAFSRAKSLSGLTANRFVPSKVKVSIAAKQFYDSNSAVFRGWWMPQPMKSDKHARILDNLIQRRGGSAEHALAVGELTERCQDTEWRCESCQQPYQACFEVREQVETTIRQSTGSTPSRQSLDSTQTPMTGSARRASNRQDITAGEPDEHQVTRARLGEELRGAYDDPIIRQSELTLEERRRVLMRREHR